MKRKPSNFWTKEKPSLGKKLRSYLYDDETLGGKIYNLYHKYIGGYLYIFFRGVRNIIRWMPVIYHDRDFDDSYIYKILRQKLIFVAEHTEEVKWYVGWEHEAKYMRICITLIDRILNDYYNDIALEKHAEKWGEMKFSRGFNFTHQNANTEEEKKLCWKELRELYDHAEKMELKSKKLLFSILNNRSGHWWD